MNGGVNRYLDWIARRKKSVSSGLEGGHPIGRFRVASATKN